jgi:hypothetical protein
MKSTVRVFSPNRNDQYNAAGAPTTPRDGDRQTATVARGLFLNGPRPRKAALGQGTLLVMLFEEFLIELF